jgi:hypothetical protein
MAKTVAQVGRIGAPKNEGGEEAKENSATAALAETPEEVEGIEDTTAAFIFGGVVEGEEEEEEETEDTIVEGVAVGASAANHPVDNQPEVDDPDIVGVDPRWSEAAKESYLKNKTRLRGVDPQLIKRVVDFHDLCKMLEFDFELELNRCFKEQKDWDDYNAAFTIAQEQLRAPELSKRETRSSIRAKKQAATGKTADPVSTPKPVSSPGKAKARGGTVGSPGKPKGRSGTVGSPGKPKRRGSKLSSSASSSDEEDESYSSALSVSSSYKEKKRKASYSTGRSTKIARYPSSSLSDTSSILSRSERSLCWEMRHDMKKMEKSIVKKVVKKLEKAFRETRKMFAEIAPIRDKYKHMIVKMDHITDGILLDAWDHLQGIGSKKNQFGQYVVPCHFHESFSGNYFKFLVFQQEHKHGMVPNDAEHKSLCNWLKNQRNLMRDYETKPQSADNNYVRYPEYYHLMIESGVTAFKY